MQEIEVIKENITRHIAVPNRNLEILKKHFGQCFDKNGTFNHETFKKHLAENEVNFSTESYGLEWLGKSYARLLATDPATTLLKADETHNRKPENAHAQHLLIKGDNLEVLKHLVQAYYEKIKMIYIDPPYNTGNDGFVYQDNRKFTVKELSELAGISEEKAQRILDFTQSKSNSHSAWLTFMYPRLYIARHLLREDGVIFVSIDDNEVAQLRLLLDEIFGEENFVANLIWEKRYGRSNNAKMITNITEHILLYRKSEKLESLKEMRSDEIGGYSNPDNDERGAWTSVSFINQVSKEERPNLSYPITNPNTGEVIIHPTNAWKVSREKYEILLKENRLYWGSDGKSKYPRIKLFLSELNEGIVPVNFWTFKEAGDMRFSIFSMLSAMRTVAIMQAQSQCKSHGIFIVWY
jgi:adenine-specific DNA-methyltransferase